MMEVSFKNKLPQEGTTKSGESLPESNSGCPTYSGGGKNLRKDTEEVGSQASSVPKATGPIDDTGIVTMENNDMQSDMDIGVGTRAQMERVRTRGRKAGPSGLSAATSVDSLMTVQSYEEDRLWAKRKRSSGASCSGSSTEGRTRTAKKGAKRGKGRSSTSRTPAASARKALAEMVANRKSLVLVGGKPEFETERETQVSRSSQAADAEAGGGRTDADESTVALRRRIEESLAVIEAKSSNLKGTSKRTLKDASEAIQEAVALLVQRTASEETRRLQADNSRLHGEIAALRKEMADMKAALGGAQHAQQQQMASDLTADIMRQVGNMVNARLEVLEERLPPVRRVRPPLAGDDMTRGMAVSQVLTEDFPELPPTKATKRAPAKTANDSRGERRAVAQPVGTGPAPGAGQGKGGRKAERRSGKVGNLSSVPSTSSAPQQQPPKQGWTLVERKKGKKSKAGAKGQKRAAKLRSPSSSAVVITLQPDAEKRGVTYASVMAGSRQKIDLAAIGVSALRFKRAATGARILEIPGTTSAKEADALADRLREVWDEDTIRVSRPVKCAELRVTGLDDSVAAEEVAAAISRVGECPGDQVKCSGLRVGSRSSTTAWVSCPVAAAKKVAQVGRILVGWISAGVSLGAVKPQRCFRCLEVGHVRAMCSSPTDRSNVCYRCGENGHKAAGCSAAAAHCVLCADAKLPAGHRLGGPACKAPKRKRGKRRDGLDIASHSRPAPSEVPVVIEGMET
ncbi:uncharacterized protein LOC123697577 [Colias croceus]|uniref:uncharacterized protein LOC123697577 n=1 Tax=Colias crocea TaxID=72248 RepID=UPI001E27F8A7|nr:uncharacterized protein LOC123697577 [Colias croceus]